MFIKVLKMLMEVSEFHLEIRTEDRVRLTLTIRRLESRGKSSQLVVSKGVVRVLFILPLGRASTTSTIALGRAVIVRVGALLLLQLRLWAMIFTFDGDVVPKDSMS